MIVKRKVKWLNQVAAVLALVALSYPLISTGAPDNCEGLLGHKTARGTLEYYIERSRERTGGEDLKPAFTNPRYERELAKRWRGEKGPRLLQDLLPEGVTFIDHELLGSAGPGIVKDAGSGETVMLRVTMEWNGRDVSTNISVPVSNLAANQNRGDKWLVGPEASACLDWGHGGGTKTTGNHTSISIMNHMAKYSVATIAIDQPFHGEGSRSPFKDANDYFAFRAALIRKYVHPSVPVINVGHSMGGLFADMMMRRSDDQALGLKQVYKGFISLSGVVDQKPGASFRDKSLAEQIKEQEQKVDKGLINRIAPGDRNLGTQLVRQNKVSALSGMFIQQMNFHHDWAPPSHLGDNYAPALYVWGIGDYLYVGNEELIDKYLLNLRNVELKMEGPSIDFKGDVVLVGHLIFDHHRMIKDPPEALRLLESYLKSGWGIACCSADEIKGSFYKKIVSKYVTPHYWMNEDNRGAAQLMAAAYYFDPAFRSFVQDEVMKTDTYSKTLEAEVKSAASRGEPPPSAFAVMKKAMRKYMLQFVLKETPETYTLIREFVEKIVGKKLEVRRKSSETAVLAYLLQAYSANLGFREYARHALVTNEITAPEFEALNVRAAEIADFLRGLDKVRKQKDGPEKEALIADRLANAPLKQDQSGQRVTEVEAREEMALVQAVRKKSYVPPGGQAEATQRNIEERERLNAEVHALRKQKEELRGGVTGPGGKKTGGLDQLMQERSRIEVELEEIQNIGSAPMVMEAIRESDIALKELLAADERVRLGVDAYMTDLHEKGLMDAESLVEIPAPLQKVFDHYEEVSKVYQASLQHVRAATRHEALLGHLGPAAKLRYEEYNRLNDEISVLAARINELDGEIWRKSSLEKRLQSGYSNALVPGYRKVERIRFMDVLDTDPARLGEVRGLMEAGWGDWKALWRERPPTEKVDLY